MSAAVFWLLGMPALVCLDIWSRKAGRALTAHIQRRYRRNA